MNIVRSGRQRVMAAAIVATALGAAAVWHFSPDSIGDALGPLRVFSDVAQDDGAGDASTPAAEADRYLPVPAPLDDERVIAALGPIANLSCKKADYAQSPLSTRSSRSDETPPRRGFFLGARRIATDGKRDTMCEIVPRANG